MKTPSSKFPILPLLLINIAAILFCAGALAVFLGWLPASIAVSADMPVPPYPPAPTQRLTSAVPGRTKQVEIEGNTRALHKCAGCGVIVSKQAVGGHDGDAVPGTAGTRHDAQARSTRTHEILIRLTDGSSRVIRDARPAPWRPGERVIVIDGGRPPGR